MRKVFRKQRKKTLLTKYLSRYRFVRKLEKDIKDLTDDNIKLKQEIRRLQEVASTSSDAPSRSMNNVDLLKRISQLEKVVYGNNE